MSFFKNNYFFHKYSNLPLLYYFFVKKKKTTPPIITYYNTKNKIKKDLTFSIFYDIIVVGGEMDPKHEHLFARTRISTPPGVSWELELRNAAGRAAKNQKKKKKNILPLLLYHTSDPFVNTFLKTFFIKFSQNPFVKY